MRWWNIVSLYSVDSPLAVAMGDPSGIGPEIIAKAWVERQRAGLLPFFAVGDVRAVQAVWLGPVERITDPRETVEVFERALPVMQVENAGSITPGEPNLEGARCSLDSLEFAVGIARSGAARALITGPVSKTQLYAIGFAHPGQTEFIAERCGVSSENAVMLLAGPTLKVVPVTTHIPLAEVASVLSVDMSPSGLKSVARWNPSTRKPRLAATRTTARIAAFIPGASPPLVIRPMVFMVQSFFNRGEARRLSNSLECAFAN